MAVTWNLFQICVTSMVTIDKFFCQMCAHKYDLYNNNFFCHTCYTNTPIWSQQTQQEKLKICHIMSHMSHKYISMVTTNTVSCHTMSSHIILRYHWYCPQLEGSDRDWWALRLPSIPRVSINSWSSHQYLEFPSIPATSRDAWTMWFTACDVLKVFNSKVFYLPKVYWRRAWPLENTSN